MIKFIKFLSTDTKQFLSFILPNLFCIIASVVLITSDVFIEDITGSVILLVIFIAVLILNTMHSFKIYKNILKNKSN